MKIMVHLFFWKCHEIQFQWTKSLLVPKKVLLIYLGFKSKSNEYRSIIQSKHIPDSSLPRDTQTVHGEQGWCASFKIPSPVFSKPFPCLAFPFSSTFWMKQGCTLSSGENRIEKAKMDEIMPKLTSKGVYKYVLKACPLGGFRQTV